jgi:hypothetical protein
MSRFKVAFDHDNMIPAPAGTATPKVIFKSDDGILLCYGTTVPSDNATGYAPGCLFLHSDGDAYNTVLYCNIGTKAAANFNVVTVAQS